MLDLQYISSPKGRTTVASFASVIVETHNDDDGDQPLWNKGCSFGRAQPQGEVYVLEAQSWTSWKLRNSDFQPLCGHVVHSNPVQEHSIIKQAFPHKINVSRIRSEFMEPSSIRYQTTVLIRNVQKYSTTPCGFIHLESRPPFTACTIRTTY